MSILALCAINTRVPLQTTPAMMGEEFTLRFVVCSQFAESSDIHLAWEVILKHANSLLAEETLGNQLEDNEVCSCKIDSKFVQCVDEERVISRWKKVKQAIQMKNIVKYMRKMAVGNSENNIPSEKKEEKVI